MMANLPQLPATVGANATGGAEERPLPSAHQGNQSKGESFASLISQAVTSNHSASKDRDSGSQSQTPSKDQAKPETSSGLPTMDAAMMLGAGLVVPVIPPIAVPMIKVATGTTQSGTNAKVLSKQATTPEQSGEASANVTTARTGKINSTNAVNSAGQQVLDPGTDQAAGGKSLVAALGLQPIKESVSTEAVAKDAATSGQETASPNAGNPLDGAGAVSGLKEASGPDASGVSSAAKIGVSGTGTPIAKSSAAMKKPEQTNRIAEASGKFLPGASAVSGLKNDALAQAGNLSTTAVSGVESGSDAGSSMAAEAVPLAADAGARTVERTHELVVQNAMRLSNSTADSLQVVIKPDTGTQLSLELRQRGDGVEVQAVLQQGDFNQLSQNWNDLQQQLQQRGIQLGDLTYAGDLNGNGNGSLQQGGNGETLDAQTVVTTVAVSGTVSSGTAANVPALAGSGGWQTWA